MFPGYLLAAAAQLPWGESLDAPSTLTSTICIITPSDPSIDRPMFESILMCSFIELCSQSLLCLVITIQVGDFLKDKYDGSTEVRLNKRAKLQVRHARYTRPTAEDLLYIEESPNYCDVNNKTGTYGTQGRFCSRTSSGTDGCNIMCCGRGYVRTFNSLGQTDWFYFAMQIQHAEGDHQGAVQLQVPLVLLRGMQDVHSNHWLIYVQITGLPGPVRLSHRHPTNP